MNKVELVAEIAAKSGVSKKTADSVLKAFTDAVIEQIKAGDKVSLAGFGSFEASKRAARIGRNPRTGEEMNIPASKNVRFRAGKAFKDAIR